MNLLLDVDVVVDICAQRQPYCRDAELAVNHCQSAGGRVWLYSGSVQILEYLVTEALQQTNHAAALINPQSKSRARQRLAAFAQGKQWLAALADEGPVFASDNPRAEQLLRALTRFPADSIHLLTRDERLLRDHPAQTFSPAQYCQRQFDWPPVDFSGLKQQQHRILAELERNLHRVLHHCRYIMGPEITELEAQLQEFSGCAYCIACSSGTDALLLAMMALDIGPGDEVITTPFSFIATAETIAYLQAKPVFVDIEPATFNIDARHIEAAITPRTRAILPVSLYGQPADMDAINAIAERHGLAVIVDGAQCFGATYQGQSVARHCDFYTTSFFPAKPLGGYGDAGAVFTQDAAHAEKLKILRVHGQNKRYHHRYIGMGGRMDTLQAAVLLSKLPYYPEEIQHRQAVASAYASGLRDHVTVPTVKPDRSSVWAQYTIRAADRQALQDRLQQQGIPTAVHYPMALHQQACFDYLAIPAGSYPVAEQMAKEVLSLPMNAYLTDTEIKRVVQAVSAT